MLNYLQKTISKIFSYKESMISYNHDPHKIKLIMTLLVRNEEEIVEKNIRFHCALGVDGVIVTNHNSTDRTVEILERLKEEGLVLEIITVKDTKYYQKQWVNKMIKVAKNKFKADWVLNADADEFYFPDSLNLKLEIAKNPCANIIFIQSNDYIPSSDNDYIHSPHFHSEAMGHNKTLHQTRNFVGVTPGNHVAFVKKPVPVMSSSITLYHYNIRNYKAYEEKIARYIGIGRINHAIRHALQLLEENRLIDDYNSRYSESSLNNGLEGGYLKKDFSISNFMKYNLFT